MDVASRSDIRRIVSCLDPSVLGLSSIRVESLRRLGVGQGNINYLLVLSGRRFVVRVNLDPHVPEKSRVEYDRLRAIEGLGLAPRAYFVSDDPAFLIIDYADGKPFRCGQRSFSDSTVEDLGSLLARIHSFSTVLDADDPSYRSYANAAREYLDAINTFTNNEFSSDLIRFHEAIVSFLPSDHDHPITLIHGDVCPQNLIFGEELRLIDWESVALCDPARDVANVIIDFGLGSRIGLFLESYSRIRSDPTILERARVYEVLIRYHYVLWEARRVFEIRTRALPEEYLVGERADRHVNEAKRQLRALRRIVEVPLLDLDGLLG